MKRFVAALIILSSTSVLAQRGKSLELVSVENNVFHFQMGNINVTATCTRAYTELSEGKKLDAECGGVIPDLGKSVEYCDLPQIAARAAKGEDFSERCYEATHYKRPPL